MAQTLASPLLAVDKDRSNVSKWPLGLTQITLLAFVVACPFLAAWTYPEGAAPEHPQTQGGHNRSHTDSAQAGDRGGAAQRQVNMEHRIGRATAAEGNKSAMQPNDTGEDGDKQTAPRGISAEAKSDLSKSSEYDGHQSAAEDRRAGELKDVDEEGAEQSEPPAAQEQMKSSTQHPLRRSQTERLVTEEKEEEAAEQSKGHCFGL